MYSTRVENNEIPWHKSEGEDLLYKVHVPLYACVRSILLHPAAARRQSTIHVSASPLPLAPLLLASPLTH